MSGAWLARAVTPEGGSGAVSRALVREHRMTMTVDGAPYAAFVCSRALLPELAAGRLLGDGRIRRAGDLRAVELSEDESVCAVVLREAPPPAAPAPIPWESEWIFAAARRFGQGTALYRATASVHLAYLYRGDDLLCLAEDISRACSMEKALGLALLGGIPTEGCWMYLSCRINADMVRRAANAGIALLATKSTPTADAVELARAMHLTLICRAWPDGFEVYCEG